MSARRLRDFIADFVIAVTGFHAAKARMFEDARHFKLPNGCSTVERRGHIASGLARCCIRL
jgi:hypothetical protein